MKEVNPRNTGVQTLGESSSDDFSINEGALDMAMDAFTQYSNPIQSIVREITSNGFDAHDKARQIRDQELDIEPFRRDITEEHIGYKDISNYTFWKYAEDYLRLWNHLRDWEEKGVTVRMSPRYEDDRKIEIEDTGVGMAPSRSEVEPNIEIYTKFFASTKRDTNDQLGFFGVGAKSPIGYTDMFEVVTRWCGTEYHYVVSMGSKRPQIDLVATEETDEPNGTIVRIGIQSGSDWRSFKNAARKQLAYFPNVIYEGSLEGRVNNDFKIYEGENFIYRTDSPFSKLHLCIGGVYYPLDYDAVGLDEPRGYSYEENGWDIPLALNFDIGEIEIVWNREDVKYTEDTINKIKDKISEVRDELQNIFNTRYSDVDDVEEWLDAWRVSQNNTLKLSEGVEMELSDEFLNQSVPDFQAFDLLETMPKNPFYLAKVYKKIDGSGYVDQSAGKMKLKTMFFFDDNKTFYWVDDNYSPKTNRYIAWEHDLDQFYLIRQSRWRVGSDLGDPEERYKAEKRYVKKYSSKVYGDFHLEKGKKNIRDDRLKQMIKFEGMLLQAFKDKCSMYADEEPTDEFSKVDKKRKKANTSTSNKSIDRDGTFPAKRYDVSGRHTDSNWSRKRIKWDKIEDPNLIVYGHRSDANDLEEVGSKLTSLSPLKYDSGYYSSGSKLNHDRAMVLKIAKSRAKYFEPMDTAFYVDDYFDEHHGFIRRYVTKKVTSEIVKTNRVPSLLTEKFDRVKNLCAELSSLSSSVSFVSREKWLEKYDKEDYVDPYYVRIAKELRGWMLKYPLFLKMTGRRKRNSMPDGTSFDEEIQSYIDSKSEVHPSLIYRYHHNHNQQDQ